MAKRRGFVEAATIMGHTSEEMTRRYAGVNLDVKQAAVTHLFGKPADKDADD